jgi:hypothetical protein
MGKYLKKLKNAGMNIAATGIALITSAMAIASGQPYGAAFPLAVASITGRAAYNDWKQEGLPPKEAVPYISTGLKEAIYAKLPFAIAGLAMAYDNAEIVPSVVLPLVLSATSDAVNARKLKKLENML